MEKQKNHPAESSRDEKIEELLQHIPDNLFFAKEAKVHACSLDFATQDVLKFQFDLSEDERYCLKYKGRNLRSYDHFIFYEPGLKGILAFFYALIEDMKRSISKKSILRTLPSASVWKLFQRKLPIPVSLLFPIPFRPENTKSAKRNPSIISSSRCRKIFSTTKSSGTTYKKDLMRTATSPFWTKK